jgi:hypothetical protein
VQIALATKNRLAALAARAPNYQAAPTLPAGLDYTSFG